MAKHQVTFAGEPFEDLLEEIEDFLAVQDYLTDGRIDLDKVKRYLVPNEELDTYLSMRRDA